MSGFWLYLGSSAAIDARSSWDGNFFYFSWNGNFFYFKVNNYKSNNQLACFLSIFSDSLISLGCVCLEEILTWNLASVSFLTSWMSFDQKKNRKKKTGPHRLAYNFWSETFEIILGWHCELTFFQSCLFRSQIEWNLVI